MKKTFTLLWCLLMMTLTTGYSYAATDEAGNRFIYLAGIENTLNENYLHEYPILANAEYWESNKMYETAPGSNIYEIVKSTNDLCWGRWFRFYYDLADLDQENMGWAYQMNVIQPSHDGTTLEAATSGVFYSTDMSVSKVADLNSTWVAPKDGTYRFRVDLNTNRLTLIPENAYVSVINDESSNFDDQRLMTLPSERNMNEYVPAGDLKFRIYNLFNDNWLNPATTTDAALVPGEYVKLTTIGSRTKGLPFSVADWKGGILKGWGISDNGGYVTIKPEVVEEKFTPMDLDAIYIAGDNNGWTITAVPRESGSEAIYKIELPAGTSQFKLLTGGEWGADEIGSNNFTNTIDNGILTYELLIKNGGGLFNNTFDTPTTEPMTMTVNLTQGTLSLPAVPTLLLTSASEIVKIDRDQLFIQTPYRTFAPWKDCSDVVLGSFPALKKNADGTYSGSLWIDEGQFKLRFIQTLNEKGTPNTVIAPPTGADRELPFNDGNVYSSAANLPENEAGYWTLDENTARYFNGGNVKFTVTPGATPKVDIEIPSMKRTQSECLYLIGDLNDWYITDGSLKLYPTDTEGYYGQFDVTPGDHRFRFYNQLGDWETGSYGDLTNDFWSVGQEDPHYGYCMQGKGNYEIINWPGGTLYVYVNIFNGYTIFSQNPISEAGNLIDPSTVKHVYAYINGQYKELTKDPDGLYSNQGYFGGTTNGECEFRLFTRIPAMSTDEPEWAGSYALSASSTEAADFDDCYVAELTFTEKDGVNTDGANPFIFKASPYIYQYNIAVDLENNKVYVEQLNNHRIIYGGITDGKVPTYATRSEFKDFYIAPRGSLLDIPAGKFNFVLVDNLSSANENYLNNTPNTYDLSEGYAWTGNDYGYSLLRNNLSEVTDWAGGKAIIAESYLTDLSKLGDLTVYFGNYEKMQETTVSPTAPGSLIYEGKVTFNGGASMDFVAFNNLERQLVISSNASYPLGTGYNNILNDGEQYFLPVNGTATGNVGFATSISIQFPSLVGTGELSYRLDLNDRTLTVNIPEANEGSIYEVVSDEDSDLDGLIGYPSTSQEDAVVLSASAGDITSTDDQETAFNLTSPEGSVIVPAGGNDVNIEFDENGCWSGSYTTRPAAAAGRKALRRVASQQATWHFNIPAGMTSNITMMVDEANSRLVINSSAHNKGFYILHSNDPYHLDYRGIEDLDRMTASILSPVSDGIYESEYTIPDYEEGKPVYIVLAKDCMFHSGISPIIYNSNVAEISEEKPSADILAQASFGCSHIQIISPSPVVKLRFDSKEYNLNVSYDKSGVENVSLDNDLLTVQPSTGCITVTASREATVAVYTITGQLVTLTTVPAGTTTLDLPAGLYIVNSTKLYVR